MKGQWALPGEDVPHDSFVITQTFVTGLWTRDR